jgi:hypothetical protein
MMIAQQNAMQAQAEQGGNEPPNNNDNKKAVQK